MKQLTGFLGGRSRHLSDLKITPPKETFSVRLVPLSSLILGKVNIKRQSRYAGIGPLGKYSSLWGQAVFLSGYNDFEPEHEILALLCSQRETRLKNEAEIKALQT